MFCVQSLRIVTTTLDLKHPEKAGTLGAGLLNLDAQVKSRVKQVKQKIPGPGDLEGKSEQVWNNSDSLFMYNSMYDVCVLDIFIVASCRFGSFSTTNVRNNHYKIPFYILTIFLIF